MLLAVSTVAAPAVIFAAQFATEISQNTKDQSTIVDG
jgi:hypothetical protein